jgi:acyl carrier protein
VDEQAIQQIVLRAIESANLGRRPEEQLSVAPDAVLYGRGSTLDSLGLVALLIDIEESLQNAGLEVTLTDASAMSEKASPFRSVPNLVRHIQTLIPA